ncbi:MAG: AAA family ATPase, partial [Glaciihabitans sp.]
MKVVAVYSTKGGVGKTTAAVNLAWEASKEFHVLLWDLDPQGAATYLLNVKPKVKGGVGSLVSGDNKDGRAIRPSGFQNLDVLPADASYREFDLVLDHAKRSGRRIAKLLADVAGDYDVVILDCPPSLGFLTLSALCAARSVLVTIHPQML